MTEKDFAADVMEMRAVDGTAKSKIDEFYKKMIVSNPPVSPDNGDIWVRNPETGETFVWDGKNWVQTSA